MRFEGFARYALLGVLLLAGFLRLYQLSSNPPGLTWDEASLGYNAYSILKTGKDEYGNVFPLSIRSFDDYKPPVYVYFSVPFIALFGLNEFSVRFLSALAGWATVLATYFLVYELITSWRFIPQRKFQTHVSLIPLVSAFLVAISPWHLQFSRAAFEGNVGLFFLTAGIVGLIKGLNKPAVFLAGTMLLVFSMYSYHSFRVVTPLVVGMFSILFWKDIQKNLKMISIGAVLGILLTIPIILSFIMQSGAESRLSMVTIFSGHELLRNSIERLEYDRSQGDWLGVLIHNRRIEYLRIAAKGYLDHWDPLFLFIRGDGGRHHHASDAGMLYLWELPFILIGVITLLFVRSKLNILLLFWLLVAPIPSAITTGTPHAVRAIAMIPILHVLTAIGLVRVMIWIRQMKKRTVQATLMVGIGGIVFMNVMYYFHQYYVHTPVEYGDFWQSANRELFEKLRMIEHRYEKIVITYHYDQPYIYYLFFNKIDPSWYQNNWDTYQTGAVDRMYRRIGRYEFRNISWAVDKSLTSTLLVAAPEEIPKNTIAIDTVRFLNGEVAFYLINR
ncbi:hypothetical protein HY468_03565 [Candidatus Roizmanbacteria bacterium]|nr:hypothetical protein [Candidatus Roizmanbacteria bacterium]